MSQLSTKKNKMKLLEMMEADDVDYIDLPWNEERYKEWNNGDGGYNAAREYVQIEFVAEEQMERAASSLFFHSRNLPRVLAQHYDEHNLV